MDSLQSTIPVNIEEEVKQSYMDYAMSVIIGRALPDARDGLKPVHRRILFAMHQMNNVWNQPHRKSARVVGNVTGRFHPHGEEAVYDALARMAQDFSSRYPLVDGQGNFGSIDGDPPAAMRYTEVRMTRLASEMLEEVGKETVDFMPNYDGTEMEPVVLPARIPNLLLNGSSGIAVGMATNIPPHNLRELAEGIKAFIRNPGISIEELMSFIPGPDFPTGAIINGKEGIKEAYETGRGIIHIRARYHIEKIAKGDKKNLVFTEMPFLVNKARLVEQIAQLAREKKIDGIAEIRDESDRDGIRLVIELKRDAVPEVVVRQLFKHTALESTFGIIMLAIVDGQPRVLNLKEAISCFVDHRKEVVTRRTAYDLRRAREAEHLLEGFKIALDNLDDVVAAIRKSKDPQTARNRLMERFGMTDVQAKAVLDLRLHRLTALEREKILRDLRETRRKISEYEAILADERLVLDIITKELTELAERYGDDRATEIRERAEEISEEDLIVDEEMVVTISHRGYIKRSPLSIYRSQRRGGKGHTGMKTAQEDFVEDLFVCSTHDYILFFSDRGRAYWLKVYEIPEAGRASRGKAIVNLIRLARDENVVAFLPVREFREGEFVVMATKMGLIKKTPLSAFSHPRATGILAISVQDGDELVSANLANGHKDIFVGTRNGKCIRFAESQVRPMGRTSMGVRAIRLEDDDEVVAMEAVEEGATILTVTENGYGKRTRVSSYRPQIRGGKGLITIKTTPRNGKVVGIRQVSDDDELMMITSAGRVVRMRASDIKVAGRNTQGVRLLAVEEGDKVVAVARLADKNGRNGEQL